MSEPKPRKFHVGTRVRDLDDGMEGVVVFAHRGEVYVEFPPILGDSNEPFMDYGGNYVHASDGAPLGEWVPLKHETVLEGILAWACDQPWETDVEIVRSIILRINAIIRGEATQ